MSTRDLTESLESVHGAHPSGSCFHFTPEIHAELAEAFPPHEPSAEELDAEYLAYQARQLAATYERSVGGASRGRFSAYVRIPGSVRPVKAGTHRSERDAWAAADAKAMELAAAAVKRNPRAA